MIFKTSLFPKSLSFFSVTWYLLPWWPCLRFLNTKSDCVQNTVISCVASCVVLFVVVVMSSSEFRQSWAIHRKKLTQWENIMSFGRACWPTGRSWLGKSYVFWQSMVIHRKQLAEPENLMVFWGAELGGTQEETDRKIWCLLAELGNRWVLSAGPKDESDWENLTSVGRVWWSTGRIWQRKSDVFWQSLVIHRKKLTEKILCLLAELVGLQEEAGRVWWSTASSWLRQSYVFWQSLVNHRKKLTEKILCL